MGIKKVVDSSEINLAIKNLDTLKGIVALSTARSMAMVAVDLLSAAQGRVPRDTGELRENGRAILKADGTAYEVGKGHYDLSGLMGVQTNLSGITANSMKGVKHLVSEVSYSRLGKKGFDVALWTHEDLNPYGGDSPKALTPGTGPKYLEAPFRERKSDYIGMIQNAAAGKKLEMEIVKHRQIVKTKVGRYKARKVKIKG